MTLADAGTGSAGPGGSAAPVATHDRPAGMCTGAGHVVVYGNQSFVAAYGRESVGLPAREAMLDVPAEGFAVLDAVHRTGRPRARWIRRERVDWRLTATPRIDPGTGEVYGVGFHLRARTDLPILIQEDREGRPA